MIDGELMMCNIRIDIDGKAWVVVGGKTKMVKCWRKYENSQKEERMQDDWLEEEKDGWMEGRRV